MFLTLCTRLHRRLRGSTPSHVVPLQPLLRLQVSTSQECHAAVSFEFGSAFNAAGALMKILHMLGRYQCFGIQLVVVAADCVTPDHVESVFKEQVKSSMLDSLLQLSRRDTRLLMLVHRGTTTRSHANGGRHAKSLACKEPCFLVCC